MSRIMNVSAETVARNAQFGIDEQRTLRPMKENVVDRFGVCKVISPRKKVQVWGNKVTGKGDLWLSESLLTEELRQIIEKVATITDSEWLKTEKKIVLKNDTPLNRYKLFGAILDKLGL